jgi:hypothetical protein
METKTQTIYFIKHRFQVKQKTINQKQDNIKSGGQDLLRPVN